MYATIEPRLIALLNDASSDTLNSYPRLDPHLDLPPLQDPNILKTSGRPLTLENVSQQNVLSYDGDTSNGRIESGNNTPEDSGIAGGALRVTSSQSLRNILSDDSEISQASTNRKRNRLENRKDDFVQLPQPPKKQKAVKQVVPPIIIGLHELPPNQAALFPPIASSSFHDSHGRNTLNTAQANDLEEETRPTAHPKTVERSEGSRNGQSISAVSIGVKARKKWTDEETKQLLLGVQKHGIGSWKKILEDKDFTFNGRKAVHIKDRFRTCFPDGFQNQGDTGSGSNDNVAGDQFMLCKPSSRHVSATTREDDRSNSSDDSITDDKGKESQVKLTKKSRAHRKNFEDLVEIGIVQPFSKSKRRERRPFSEEEDRNILLGFQTYGQSSWTLIQRDSRFGLESRKPTDIRDRFRNRFRDKYFCEEEGKKLKRVTSTGMLYETQSSHGILSSQTQDSSPLQDRAPGSSQIHPDISSTSKQASQPAPFTFKGSFTDLLGPLPVTYAPDTFPFSQSFDWQDNTATFSSSIGEMDISRLLLDENWPPDTMVQTKQKQNVTDISSICSGIPPPASQLMTGYNVSGTGEYEISQSVNLPLPAMRGDG